LEPYRTFFSLIQRKYCKTEAVYFFYFFEKLKNAQYGSYTIAKYRYTQAPDRAVAHTQCHDWNSWTESSLILNMKTTQ